MAAKKKNKYKKCQVKSGEKKGKLKVGFRYGKRGCVKAKKSKAKRCRGC